MRHDQDANQQAAMIWCLGMQASGSTWLFNATRATAAAARPDATTLSCYADNLKMLAPAREPADIRIVKTHQLDPKAEAFLASQATSILLTLRDPRDAVTSLMQHMRHSFFAALATVERSALFCQTFFADPRAILLRYEAGYIDTPRTFDQLAALLGAELAESQRSALFNASRRAAIEAEIARLPDLPTAVADRRSGDIVDLVSQWHLHHANRTGEIGRWRRLLSPDAARIVEQRLGVWMQANGYALETETRTTVSVHF